MIKGNMIKGSEDQRKAKEKECKRNKKAKEIQKNYLSDLRPPASWCLQITSKSQIPQNMDGPTVPPVPTVSTYTVQTVPSVTK